MLLFAFQGEAILRQPLIIAMLALPILIQVFFNSALAYGLNRAAGEKHYVACPSALIGASNFFELAVAAAISLFGFDSGAALATVVGVLIEVPVMLSVVASSTLQGLVRGRRPRSAPHSPERDKQGNHRGHQSVRGGRKCLRKSMRFSSVTRQRALSSNV